MRQVPFFGNARELAKLSLNLTAAELGTANPSTDSNVKTKGAGKGPAPAQSRGPPSSPPRSLRRRGYGQLHSPPPPRKCSAVASPSVPSSPGLPGCPARRGWAPSSGKNGAKGWNHRKEALLSLCRFLQRSAREQSPPGSSVGPGAFSLQPPPPPSQISVALADGSARRGGRQADKRCCALILELSPSTAGHHYLPGAGAASGLEFTYSPTKWVSVKDWSSEAVDITLFLPTWTISSLW